MLQVFVSSVIEGLENEREVAEKSIKDLILDPDQFEIFPAYPGTPREICIEKVKECDIFILILKDNITNIVLEEFQKAEEFEKKILIFLKKDPNNLKLKSFLKGIEKDYTYKPFSTLKDFEKYLKKSIQYLLVHTFKVLKDIDIVEENQTEILTDETITVEAFQKKWSEYDLEEGDVIKGLVRELGNDIFNVYFMDEESFSDYLNDNEFYYIGGTDITSYAFNEEIKEDGTYYLVFDTNAILLDRRIKIKLKRIKYF